jgi:gamma-resorcylate decarboxylase
VPPSFWTELSGRLLDMHDRRLREMDANGMEMMILSLNAPAVQAVPDRSQGTHPHLMTFSAGRRNVVRRSGFTNELRRMADARPEIVLVDLHRLYHGS